MIDPSHAGLINDFRFKIYPGISQIKILKSLILNQKSKQADFLDRHWGLPKNPDQANLLKTNGALHLPAHFRKDKIVSYKSVTQYKSNNIFRIIAKYW